MSKLSKAIDALGTVRAHISDLQTEAKALEKTITAAGFGSSEGAFFRTTVSETETARVDWKAVAAVLEPSRQLVTAHTKVSHGVRLIITARLKAAA